MPFFSHKSKVICHHEIKFYFFIKTKHMKTKMDQENVFFSRCLFLFTCYSTGKTTIIYVPTVDRISRLSFQMKILFFASIWFTLSRIKKTFSMLCQPLSCLRYENWWNLVAIRSIGEQIELGIDFKKFLFLHTYVFFFMIKRWETKKNTHTRNLSQVSLTFFRPWKYFPRRSVEKKKKILFDDKNLDFFV